MKPSRIIILGLIVVCFGMSAFGQTEIHLNKVIAKLERGEIVIGTWSLSMSVYSAMGLVKFAGKTPPEELLTTPTLDYVLIDLEHMPFDIDKLQMFLMAFHSKREVITKGNLQPNIATLVRIPCDASGPIEPYIKQVLDAGAFGVIVPHCTNAEDAERVVKACRYPQPADDPHPTPPGERGASPRRST